jgi:hypothetical protein
VPGASEPGLHARIRKRQRNEVIRFIAGRSGTRDFLLEDGDRVHWGM